VCEPVDSTESVSSRGILFTVEVRGKSDQCLGPDFSRTKQLITPLPTTRVEADFRLQTERHSYEKCQYEEFKKRVAKMDELRAAKGGQRSN
jgi:hypothetical protein